MPGSSFSVVSALLRSAWRYWRGHRWQAVLLLLGIALGVAIVFAVDIANSSAKRAMTLSLDAVTGASTHRLSAVGGVDETHYARMRVKYGWRNIAPVVTGVVRYQGETFELFGVDLFAEAFVRRTLDGAASQRSLLSLMQPGSVYIARQTAERLNMQVGSTFSVQTEQGDSALHVDGVLEVQQQAAFGSMLFVDISTAQQLLMMQGRLSQIDLVYENPEQLSRIASEFPGLTITDTLRHNRSVVQMSQAFHVNLQAMSLLALLVGGFLVYNSITLSVLQRRRQFGLLRVIGVSRMQLALAVLGETSLFTLLAIVIGMAAGYLMGSVLLSLMTRTISDLYFQTSVSQIFLEPLVMLRVVLLTVAAVVLSALAPAIEAARSPPVTLLQRSSVERQVQSLLPRLFVAGLLFFVLAVIILVIWKHSLIVGFTALFLTVMGFVLLVPMLLARLASLLVGLSLKWGRDSVVVRHSIRSLAASPSRVNIAIASLTVAVAATAGVGIMIGSFRGSVEQWLGHTLEADVYLSDLPQNGQSAGSVVGFDLSLLEIVRDLAMVESVRAARWAQLQAGAQSVRVLALSGLENAADKYHLVKSKELQPQLRESRLPLWAALGRGDGIMVSEPFAWKNKIVIGDNLSMHTDLGLRKLEVLAIYTDYASNGAIVMDLARYRELWRDEKITSIAVTLTADTTLAVALPSLQRLVAAQDRPIIIRPSAQIKSDSMVIFDRTFAITKILRWLTVMVAFMGILSAIIAQVLERRHEFRTLYELGVTRLQLAAVMLWQAFFMGLAAGLLALPLAWLMSRLLVEVINRRSFGWSMHYELPASVVFETIGLAMMAALLAACYPAWKMARRRIVGQREG